MRHMRKVGLLLAAMAMPATLYAVTTSAYLGLGIGVTATKWQNNTTVTNLPSANTDENFGSMGLEEDVALGLQWNFQSIMYLASELYFTNSHTSSSQRVVNLSFSQDQDIGYGIRAIPGVHVSADDDLGLVVGYNVTRFQRKGNQLNTLGNNFKKQAHGLQIGMSGQAFVSPHISFGVLETFNFYNQLNTQAPLVDANLTDDTDYKLSASNFQLRATVYFTPQPSKNYFNNSSSFEGTHAYFGLSGARDDGMAHVKDTQGDNLRAGMQGYAIDLYSGWRSSWDWFSLGAQASVGLGEGLFKEVAENDSGSDQEFRRKTTYSLSVLPGIKLNQDDLLYLRVGGGWGEFSWVGQQPASLGVSFTDTYRGGYEVGFGNEMSLTQHLALRLEYLFTRYGKISVPDFSFAPRTHDFTVGLTYYI